MNLGEMRTAIRDNLGALSTDPYFTDAMLTNFINKSLRKIDSEFEWPWNQKTGTLSTVNGQSYITLPADWAKTRALTINDNESFEPVSLVELRSAGTTGSGQPDLFAIEDDRLYLTPTPNAVFTITHDYTTFEPGLSGNSDVPRLPTSYHDAIIDLALYYACVKAKEMERADRYKDSYKEWVQIMKQDARRMIGSLSVRVRPGSLL